MATKVLPYSFDRFNRLIVKDPLDPLRVARVVEGRMSTDSKNRLLYHVETGAQSSNRHIPHKFILDGSWKLTPNHDLELSLHESERNFGQRVYLRGSVVRAEASAIVFALEQHEQMGKIASHQLTLSGNWQADSDNRLNFLVGRSDGLEDRLILKGGWEMGTHNEIIYRYRKRAQSEKDAKEHTLVFDGSWDLTGTDRLTYRISGSDNSAFGFRASFQSPSLLARDGRIIYQVGIDVTGSRARYRRISIFGTWKLHRDLSVSFEIPYTGGRIDPIRFEGTYSPTRRDRISVALRNNRHEPIGLTVTFTKDVLPDISFFLELRKDAEERSAIGGVRVRF